MNPNQKINFVNLFQELNSEIISVNITIETNPSLMNTLKKYSYYKEECEKLSSYIINIIKSINNIQIQIKIVINMEKFFIKGAFGKVNLSIIWLQGD